MKYRWPVVAILSALLFLGGTSLVYAQSTGQEFFEMGNSLYNTKKYEQAIAAYTQAIQLQPKTAARAYLNRARAHNMLKQYAESVAYYEYYMKVVPDAANDKKVSSELKAAQKNAAKVKDAAEYSIPEAQRNVLSEIQRMLKGNEPYLTRENGGMISYYQVLIRTGYAAPDLYEIQEKLANGLVMETFAEVQPAVGQPAPALDRLGWEHIANKLEKLSSFHDANYDKELVNRLKRLAQGWSAYYLGNMDSAISHFRAAQGGKNELLSAWWGMTLASIQISGDEEILNNIENTQKQYIANGRDDAAMYFDVLRAYVKKSMGKMDECLGLIYNIIDSPVTTQG